MLFAPHRLPCLLLVALVLAARFSPSETRLSASEMPPGTQTESTAREPADQPGEVGKGDRQPAAKNEAAGAQGETDARLPAAIRKSLALIQASAAEYRERRQCFSCHHQALPTLVVTAAAERGYGVDAEDLKQQIARTHEHLEKGKSSYQEGRGQGGRADTAGYALWALEVAEFPADEITQLVADYLLRWQADQDHWTCSSVRPPSESSHFTTTYLALRGLSAFGTPAQRPAIDKRKADARKWLLDAAPSDTEDRVFRFASLALLEVDEPVLAEAAADLLRGQREDGGWAQNDSLPSDAYATATALVMLHEYGRLPVADEAYRRGVRFLLDQQRPDGSWHVASRSKPFQTYFESGFPHGKDQFISIAASCWATQTLILASPAPEAAARP